MTAALLPAAYDLAVVTTATALMWVPYTLALMGKGGLMGAMGNRTETVPLPAWAERARRAHANAVENLALFAPLVLLAILVKPADAMVATAAHVYLIARLVHYAVYVAGIPVVRTLAFVTGWGATVAIALAILV